MTDTIAAAWIGAGGTLVAAAVGIGAIVFQIGRQAKLNRDSVAENERRRLKSRMYEEVEAACRTVIDAHASYVSHLLLAAQQVQIAAYSHRDKRPYPLPRARIMELAKLKSEFHDAALSVIFLIEQRQFVVRDILVFRTALSAALHDADRKFQGEFFNPAMRMLPTDAPDGTIFPYEPPEPQDADALFQLAASIVNDLNSVTAFVGDFSVEMQNVLVGDLFDNIAKHRVPIDPQEKVVKLVDAASLEQYFLNETNWGHHVRQINAAATEQLSADGSRAG